MQRSKKKKQHRVSFPYPSSVPPLTVHTFSHFATRWTALSHHICPLLTTSQQEILLLPPQVSQQVSTQSPDDTPSLTLSPLTPPSTHLHHAPVDQLLFLKARVRSKVIGQSALVSSEGGHAHFWDMFRTGQPMGGSALWLPPLIDTISIMCIFYIIICTKISSASSQGVFP